MDSVRSGYFTKCIFLIASGLFLIVAVPISGADEKKIARNVDFELPLYEPIDYSSGFFPFVEIQVFADPEGSSRRSTIAVDVYNVTVEKRIDGKMLTSIRATGALDEDGRWYSKVVILVPVWEEEILVTDGDKGHTILKEKVKRDDVAVWTEEVLRWRKLRSFYLASIPKPKRILPKK